MTWTEALEHVVAITRVERYRWLCSDENPDVEQREAYRILMVHKAIGKSKSVHLTWIPPPKPVAIVQPNPIDPWLVLIRACEDWNTGCCAHPLPTCTRFAKNVTRDDCIKCLTKRGITP